MSRTQYRRESGNDTAQGEWAATARNRWRNYSCALASLLVTAVVAVVGYPFLVALTRPFAMLSTTVLVFILLAVLALVWLVLDVLWDRRSKRRPSQ